jgi:hypothetical protein
MSTTTVATVVRSWEMATGIDDFVCACMGKKYENVPVVNWISGDDNLDYDMRLSDFGLGDKEIFDDWIETMDRFKAVKAVKAVNPNPYEFADRDKLCFDSWKVMNVKFIMLDAFMRKDNTAKSTLDRWAKDGGFTFYGRSKAHDFLCNQISIQQQLAILDKCVDPKTIPSTF